MSLHFVLDGYNIIKQIPDLAKLKLEEGRESLFRVLEQDRPQGSMKNKVTVVFDGQANIGGFQRGSFLEIIFSCDESADDKIKKIVSHHENKKNVTVVTDDKEIKFYVRALGAKVISVDGFLNQIKSHRDETYRLKKKISQRERKTISRSLEYKINAEFEEIWLGKKGRRQHK